jgi:iron complex outermembrane receptor protein
MTGFTASLRRRTCRVLSIAAAVSIAFPLKAQTVASPAAPAGAAAAEPDNVPVRSLGVVTVVGAQPTSLPTQIPATMEGVTREQIARTVNASDSEDTRGLAGPAALLMVESVRGEPATGRGTTAPSEHSH